MVAKLLNLTQKDIVARAKSCLSIPSKYRLKYPNGGADPETATPFDKYKIEGAYFNVADCIGFALWCAGISRRFTGTDIIPAFPDTPSITGNYINCQSMIEECLGFPRRAGQPKYPGGRFFKKVYTPVPGDFIVYWGNPHGHIGVISAVPAEAPSNAGVTDTWITKDTRNAYADLRIIHCSPSNEKKFIGRAVGETDANVWRGKNAHFIHLNREELLGRVIV